MSEPPTWDPPLPQRPARPKLLGGGHGWHHERPTLKMKLMSTLYRLCAWLQPDALNIRGLVSKTYPLGLGCMLNYNSLPRALYATLVECQLQQPCHMVIKYSRCVTHPHGHMTVAVWLNIPTIWDICDSIIKYFISRRQGRHRWPCAK
jgi:hypothetical protein